jgi:hypothetical protein
VCQECRESDEGLLACDVCGHKQHRKCVGLKPKHFTMEIGYVCARCQISEAYIDEPSWTKRKVATPELIEMLQEATVTEAMAWEESTWRSMSFYIRYVIVWARQCRLDTRFVLPTTPFGAKELFEHVRREGRSWAFCRGLRSALSAWHVLAKKTDPFQDGSLKRFFNGLRKRVVSVVKPARPLRMSWLKKIRTWNYLNSDEAIAVRDAVTSGLEFIGIRRMSEIVVSGSGRTGLLIRDVKVTGKRVHLHIRGTKVDRFNDGNDVVLAAKPRSGFPLGEDVNRLLGMLEEEGQKGNLPLIQGTRGLNKSYGRRQFSGIRFTNWAARFKKLLQWAIGLKPDELKRYSTHSLRRGGCSHAFNQGASVEAIMALGAWSARSSFELYRFLAPKDMVKLTRAM